MTNKARPTPASVCANLVSIAGTRLGMRRLPNPMRASPAAPISTAGLVDRMGPRQRVYGRASVTPARPPLPPPAVLWPGQRPLRLIAHPQSGRAQRGLAHADADRAALAGHRAARERRPI